MTTTISDGITVLTLPDTLLRTDEFSWSPISQSATRTLDGGLWIDQSVATVGEPITLQGGRDSGDVHGEMTRSDLAALAALLNQPGVHLQLTFRGTTYDVVPRHDATALDAVDVFQVSDPQPTDWVIPTIRLMTI